MDNAALGHAMFDAVEAGDIEKFKSFYASDAVVWHNFDPVDHPAEQVVAQLESVMKMVKSLRYVDRRYLALPDGALLQHTSQAELPDGQTMRVHHILRLYIENNKVRRVEEYFDSRQAGH